jgi:predicted HNH restriction endonuclease
VTFFPNWKIVLSLVAIFVTGAITGSFITLVVGKYEVHRQSDPHKWVELTMGRWRTRLRLSDDQERKLRPIVEETVNDLRNLRSLDLRETDDILARAQERIEPELTERQRRKFQRMREERRRRLRDWLNIDTRR